LISTTATTIFASTGGSMALIPCDECGKQVSDKATACPNCGNPISQSAEVGSDRGAEDIAREEVERARRFGIPPARAHRPATGDQPMGSRTAEGFGGTQKRILPAAILAFMLGFLGIHRFYVGKTGTGIIMVVLSATVIGLFVTSIWALVDLVMIVVGSFEDADGRPITEWT
jgi:hypothetical protein